MKQTIDILTHEYTNTMIFRYFDIACVMDSQ